ncbi:efflux RND transporter permease subunit [Inhella sp.]|uniref:efflux RND transporter permease subunit n=1 Tax=Inhella sp. TaxID=1921806 RepID=UPI0035B32BA0
MQLPELSIRRPVLAVVMSLLILLVGGVSYQQLTVREYPRIDEPVVTVSTRLAGASSEVIESQITKTLEDSIAGIEGVEVLTSISRSERSQITVRFKLNKDPDNAAADVRDRVARVRNRLPQATDEPQVGKVEADAQPMMRIAFPSDQMSPLEVTDYVNRVVRPKLQTALGVADVEVNGDRRYAMRIWVEPERLAAYRLTVQDVEDALRRQNLEVPAGRIESEQREFNVTARTDLNTPAQFEDIVVAQRGGLPVRLRDVARVEEAAADERSRIRLNGRPSVGLGVVKQATANPLEVSAAVNKMLPAIRDELPPGLEMELAVDTSVFIDRSVQSVYTTIIEAVVLVALVVFVFLRTLRASIIPLVTIPVSLIGSFALIQLAGFSINTLTLLALVLAIGLVVDDAIVVLENIYRYIEKGMSPFQAAIKGSREIGFAVVAMTLTLAAVFAPLAFTPGRTGRLFTEFAVTLAGAVIVSGFVALTLTPMMCSLLLKAHAPGRFERVMERGLHAVDAAYRRALNWVLHRRWVTLLIMLASGAGSAWLWNMAPRELAPIEDRGVIFTPVSAPDGATLGYTARYLDAAARLASEDPEAERVFAFVGGGQVSSGAVIVRYTDWETRTRSTKQLAQALQPKLAQLPGVQAFPVTPPSLGQGFRSRPLGYVIIANDSYANLGRAVQQFQTEMAKNPGFVQVDTDLRLNKPELVLDVDRERAQDAGVSIDQVARAVETLLGSRNVTRYKRDAEQYDVMVQLEASSRTTPEQISQLFVRGRNDTMVPLSSLVKVRETVSPRELNHFNQRRAVVISANLAPGFALGTALAEMDRIAKEVLPPGYATDLTDVSREFRESSGALGMVFVLAVLFIFLVLAAQFESFIDPFIILMAVPLSMVGALLALHFTGNTINTFSQIGLITLVGLITKHGILIVEFSNQLRRAGEPLMEAVLHASVQRLRPILMTTGAMVLGALPLALAHGAGAESRQPIGWVIVGGMLLGTLLTLFVVPTLVTLMARKQVAGPRTEAGPVEA